MEFKPDRTTRRVGELESTDRAASESPAEHPPHDVVDEAARGRTPAEVLSGVPLLGSLAVLGMLLVAPAGVALDQAVGREAREGIVVVIGFVLEAGILFLITALGVGAARHVGLHVTPLEGLEAEPVDRARAASACGLAVGLATSAAIVLAILSRWVVVPEAAVAGPRLPIHLQLTSSIGAGFVEEVVFRLGAMSIAAWVLVQLFQRRAVTDPIAWIALLGSTALFAASHMPQTSLLVGEPSPSVIAAVWVGNGLVGGLAGWLYWKRGILAAMLFHAAFNVWFKLVFPWLAGTASG